jgi:membrane protease YdiL (CAAX protease family)
MVLPGVLLLASLGTLAWFVRGDIAEYAAFKTLTNTAARQARYRAWIVKSLLLFCGMTLVALLLLRRVDALAVFPAEFGALSHTLRSALPSEAAFGNGFFAGLLGAIAVGAVLGAVLSKRFAGRRPPVMLGDIEPLLPTNPAETAHAAVLSLNAGLSEELFFRLLVPLLLVLLVGNALYAFAIAAVIFGLVHVYQGWVGVLATMVLGLGLTAIYLATGNIWIAVAVHAGIDIVGLVVRPTIARLIPAR